MVVWCVVSRGDGHQLTTDDVIHLQAPIPCGYLKVVAGIQPSEIHYYLKTMRSLALQIRFLVFHIDSFSEFCELASYVHLCLHDQETFHCPSSRKYCGYRKPWVETTDVSWMVVKLKQHNVRYPCNITFSYTSLERDIAYVYMEYEHHDIVDMVDFVSNTMTIRLFYHKGITQYYWNWRIKQKLGNILRLNSIQTCCFAGTLQMYDGFNNYYMMAEEQISNYSKKVLNVTSTYYIATVIFQLNETSVKLTENPLFILRFKKEVVNVRYLDVDMVISVKNYGGILHSVFAMNMTNGGYPNVSVEVRTFSGWNDNLCSFGGYSFTHEITIQSLNMTYQQGPFCNGQAPSVPFIGTHGPKHLVFGSFQYWLKIYAFGPLYEIDIGIIIRKSSCEGLFEPMYMCTEPIPGYNNQFHADDQAMRFVNATNYNIICSAAMQPNNMLLYHLRIFNIRTCLIF